MCVCVCLTSNLPLKLSFNVSLRIVYPRNLTCHAEIISRSWRPCPIFLTSLPKIMQMGRLQQSFICLASSSDIISPIRGLDCDSWHQLGNIQLTLSRYPSLISSEHIHVSLFRSLSQNAPSPSAQSCYRSNPF